ncbi:response regulator [Nostoc punctiforme]|uniref:Response regulator receiver protein n=1 Tax=Nostoc punctiforme (strain ATCC 29133 / PCC 73102) TaxID=63737 RepID=B2JBG1_NOSP7|nr:response regulator [Nostoc punctiforme]ACC85265.1 response regulator receiver protein [Nostoc punctiforme PCC 73102]
MGKIVLHKSRKCCNASKLILVCDDIFDNCFFLQTVLEIEGYQVETVDSGAAALAFLESKRPALLLLDVMIPVMNGYEVVHHIKNNPLLESLPIVLITADEREFFRKEIDVKVDGFIRKPVEPDVLIKYVQATLRQSPCL